MQIFNLCFIAWYILLMFVHIPTRFKVQTEFLLSSHYFSVCKTNATRISIVG